MMRPVLHVLIALLVCGCGHKGPLYLPDSKPQPKRPAASTAEKPAPAPAEKPNP